MVIVREVAGYMVPLASVDGSQGCQTALMIIQFSAEISVWMIRH